MRRCGSTIGLQWRQPIVMQWVSSIGVIQRVIAGGTNSLSCEPSSQGGPNCAMLGVRSSLTRTQTCSPMRRTAVEITPSSVWR